jgi:hypothetical protein
MNVPLPEVLVVEPGAHRESEDFLDLTREEGGAEGGNIGGPHDSPNGIESAALEFCG